MKIIHWPRGAGRTTKLCELAKKDNGIVLTTTEVRAELLRRQYGVEAIQFERFKFESKYYGTTRPIYMDDADEILRRVIGREVDTISTCQTDPLVEAVHMRKP